MHQALLNIWKLKTNLCRQSTHQPVEEENKGYNRHWCREDSRHEGGSNQQHLGFQETHYLKVIWTEKVEDTRHMDLE